MRKTLIALGLAFTLFTNGLIGAASSATADEVSDRAAKVELVKTKYLPTLAEQYAQLKIIKARAKVAPSILKQVNPVYDEFEENYQTILNGLKNPNQDINAVIALCEEEVEEFNNYIYLLNQQLSKLKTITCTKGKVSKKIIALAPKCPAGYKQK